MKHRYHSKRTCLSRHYIKDHKRRLARFNYSVKQRAKACDTQEWMILVVLQMGYTASLMKDRIFKAYKHFKYSDYIGDYIKDQIGGSNEQTSEETKA